MGVSVKTAALLGLLSALSFTSFAEGWTGALVDSKCFDGEERNVGPTDSLINVDRDRGLEIRFCSPSHKTKTFAIVDRDGGSFHLDMGGDAKAADLVQKTGKKSLYIVTVTGARKKNTVQVDSIAIAR